MVCCVWHGVCMACTHAYAAALWRTLVPLALGRGALPARCCRPADIATAATAATATAATAATAA